MDKEIKNYLKFYYEKGYSFIAEDSDGAVYIYKEKPQKDVEGGTWNSENWHRLDTAYFNFTFLDWNDKKPTLIKNIISETNEETKQDKLVKTTDTIKQIEIFSSVFEWSLVNTVNEFCKTHKVIDIDYKIKHDNDMLYHYVMIVYEK